MLSHTISHVKNDSFIQSYIPLHDKNWFSTGGNARYFCEPRNAHEFCNALQFAKEHHASVFVLGSGANTLISDDGFDGLVIHPQLKEISSCAAQPDTSAHTISSLVSSNYEESNDLLLTAGAGVVLEDLIDYCLKNNLSGLEEFAGIPGTIGGAVFINLHYFEFLLDQFLVSAQVIHKETGAIETVDKQWFGFGYNQSTLCKQDYFLVNATFRLKKITSQEVSFAQGRIKEIIRHRAARYPQKNTCGSFFRNFHQDEVTLISNGKKVIWVAYYLDKIGVKGTLKVGGAIVSYQHANMIVNQAQATSADIVSLARKMQELVYKEFGIVPQPECRLVGFKEYPLLK